ncbi:MAG: NAD(P)/FAD-dependent oxidoreductase [Gemmatimonadota bacterium]
MRRDPARVVILGAGFGGLWAARALKSAPVSITLLDRNNYHTFLPLLYQVGAAELEPFAIARPVRTIVRRQENVHFLMADARAVDPERKVVRTSRGVHAYDYLVVAIGSVQHDFGVPGARRAFPLKTLEDGVALRSRILSRFEVAALEPDAVARRRTLRFVIVGGGPTGVEFAGALAELVRGPLARDYPALDGEASIVLLEARDRLLGEFAERLSAYAARRLERMGVEVRLGASVAEVEPAAVRLADGTSLPTETVAWTAGVRGEPSAERWGFPMNRAGRVLVAPTLQVPGHPEVYVVGDLARVEDDTGSPLPGVAQVAMQGGAHAAANIRRALEERPPEPFEYRDYGTMAVIGRNAAVARLAGREFTGFVAWLLWLGIHLVKLIGFRNRLAVLLNWAWDYLFFERVARILLPFRGQAPRWRPGDHPPLPDASRDTPFSGVSPGRMDESP